MPACDRKSHMSFRLVQNSVTLDDLERRIAPSLRFFTEFGSFRSALNKSGLREKCSMKNVLLIDISFMATLAGANPNESVKVKHPPVASENLTNNQS